MNQRIMIASAIILGVSVTFAETPQLEQQLKELSRAPVDYALAGKWYNLAKDIPDDGQRQEALKAAAAALIYSQKGDVYQKSVRTQIDHAVAFEGELLKDCPDCRGGGESTRPCSACKGSGRCQYANCQGGRHRVRQINGDKYETCRECKGSGRCQKCKGSGNIKDKCARCGGKGKSMDKELVLAAYKTHAAAAADWDRRKNVLSEQSVAEVPDGMKPSASIASSEVSNPPKIPDSQGNSRTKYSESHEESVYRSLMERTRNNSEDLEDEFDFEEYKKWKSDDTTKIQKKAIVESLFSAGLESGFYKDYIRCYLARVPDGLSFIVTDVKDRDYGKVNGPQVYCVTIDLMCEGRRYRMNGKNEEWKGPSWQNSNLRRFLSSEVLLPSSLALLIPIEDDEIETWKKGKILMSSGWVYDIQIWNGIVTHPDGTTRPVRTIQSSGTVFRSASEREDLDWYR